MLFRICGDEERETELVVLPPPPCILVTDASDRYNWSEPHFLFPNCCYYNIAAARKEEGGGGGLVVGTVVGTAVVL